MYTFRSPIPTFPGSTFPHSPSSTGFQSGILSTSLSKSNLSTTMGPNHGTQQGEQLSKTNLYIRGLQQGTTDKDLVTMCAHDDQKWSRSWQKARPRLTSLWQDQDSASIGLGLGLVLLITTFNFQLTTSN